jgi:transposase
MIGQHTRSESPFYYFRIEDQVPEDHLLRRIDGHVSFDFVPDKLRDSYSETGRPSIDPEVLLRILLLGYLYGITSERKLVEELRMHLAWRRFTGLGFDQGRSPITRRFPRTGMDAFKSRICFRSCSSASSINVWLADWSAVSTCRPMAPSYRRM